MGRKTKEQKLRDANNAVHRRIYYERKDQGLCVRCGKRWAEAGKTKCRPCRESYQKYYRDNNMREYIYQYKKTVRAERKANNQCIECGAPLMPEEIGVNSCCSKCRAKDMERISMRRLRMRIHGIKRKG